MEGVTVDSARLNNRGFWYAWPLAERQAAAALFDELPTAVLRLPHAIAQRLRETDRYPRVGDLMRCGPEIEALPKIAEGRLLRVHQALMPFFDAAKVRASTDGSLSLADSLTAIISLPPFDAGPWYDSPLPPRRRLAEEVGRTPLSALPLDDREQRRLGPYGALPLWGIVVAGPSITNSAKPAILTVVHERIRQLALAHRQKAGHLRSLETLFSALGDRPDLWSLTFEDLDWPRALGNYLALPREAKLGRLVSEGMAPIRPVLTADPGHLAELVEVLQAVVELPKTPDSYAIARLWRKRGTRVEPEDLEGPEGGALRDAVHGIIGRVIGEAGGNGWDIVRRRYGLLGAKKVTLQELGTAYGLTRERIRQLQNQQLLHLKRRMATGTLVTPPDRVHPAVDQALKQLKGLVDSLHDQPEPEAVVLAASNRHLGLDQDTVDPVVYLFADLVAVERIVFRKRRLDTIWHRLPAPETSRLYRRITAMADAVVAGPNRGLPLEALAAAANERLEDADKLAVASLMDLIRLCSTIEAAPDERYQARIDCLSRTGQVERILEQHGRPMLLEDIAREANHRLLVHGARLLHPDHVRNRFSPNNRIVPIGRSGYWILRDWTHVETAPIADLMERCLAEANRMMTAKEIHEWILQRRPASLTSVNMYLGSDARFAKVHGNHYGLAIWPEIQAALAWDRERVAAFIVDFFEANTNTRRPFADLAAALAAAAGVSVEQAANLLVRNPVVLITRSGQREVALRPDHAERLTRPRRYTRDWSQTLHGRIVARARELVATAPGADMALVDLRNQIMFEFDRPPPTVYGYLRDIEGLEVYRPGPTRDKRIRLRSAEDGPAAEGR